MLGISWLRDDGFGGEVARRLSARTMPSGVAVMDAGTGGLDLAYEVMRGYDALVIVDVSHQGGEPGTLYVMEPDEASVDGDIADGEAINPHGMDPKTVLRFVKSIGAWRAGSWWSVRADRRQRPRLRAPRAGAGRVRTGRRLVAETVDELRGAAMAATEAG